MKTLEEFVSELQAQLTGLAGVTIPWQAGLIVVGCVLLLELLVRPVWRRLAGARAYPLDVALDHTVGPLVGALLAVGGGVWGRTIALTLNILRRLRRERIDEVNTRFFIKYLKPTSVTYLILNLMYIV